jgi:membrane protein required for colicin V production
MQQTPNLLDLCLLIVMVFFLVKALMRGFVREVIGLVGAVAAIVTSVMFYEPLGRMLADLTAIKAAWWPAVAFALILLVVFSIFLYIGSMLHRLILSGPLSGLDRLLGAGVGLVKGLLICYLLINLLLLVNPFKTLEPLQKSMVSPYVVRAGNFIKDMIPENLLGNLQKKAGLIKPEPAQKQKP